MELVGEAVPDRDAGVRRELLDDRLPEAAVLDAVVDPAEDPGRVLHRLLVADLRAGRAEVRDVGALVVGGDLEGDPGPGRRLLEDEGDVLAAQARLLVAAVLRGLEVGRQLQQEADLVGREVQLLEEAAVAQVDGISNLRAARAHGEPRCGRLASRCDTVPPAGLLRGRHYHAATPARACGPPACPPSQEPPDGTATNLVPHKIFLAGRWVDSPDTSSSRTRPARRARRPHLPGDARAVRGGRRGRRRGLRGDPEAPRLRARGHAPRHQQRDPGPPRGARPAHRPRGRQADPRRARRGRPGDPHLPPRRRGGRADRRRAHPARPHGQQQGPRRASPAASRPGRWPRSAPSTSRSTSPPTSWPRRSPPAARSC